MNNLFTFLFCITIFSSENTYPIQHLSVSITKNQTQEVQQSDEDLPFDNSTGLGKVFNWAARLFLWFIYFTIFMIAVSATHWFITAKGFWSWVVCYCGVFFYGMLLGRYWGYGTCLIVFAVSFTALKIYFTAIPNKKKTKSIFDLLFKGNSLRKDPRKSSEELPKNTGVYNQDESA